MELAALQRKAGDPRQAVDTLLRLAGTTPLAIPLLARPLVQDAIASGRQAEALAMLQASYDQSPSLDVLDAIASLQPADEARTTYVRHLDREPSLVAASKWLAGEKFEHEDRHPQVQRALELATRPLLRYRCAACGFESRQHFWQCPGCQAWDSYPPRRVEEL
jgi:lipopolysaccharide biosynthesis regulator YciM